MKRYEKPQLLLERFETEDVIMESGIFKGITELDIEQRDNFSDLIFN